MQSLQRAVHGDRAIEQGGGRVAGDRGGAGARIRLGRHFVREGGTTPRRRLVRALRAPVILLALAACGALLPCPGRAQSKPPVDAERLAKSVTIYRDTYGVPHVWAKTDAGAVFGFAFAQAEDNFARVEKNFLLALGRSAEAFGAT